MLVNSFSFDILLITDYYYITKSSSATWDFKANWGKKVCYSLIYQLIDTFLVKAFLFLSRTFCDYASSRIWAESIKFRGTNESAGSPVVVYER